MKPVLATLALLLASASAHALTRPYWQCSVLALATGQCTHTHVQVTGVVAYTRMEADGDLHIRLNDPKDARVFIIAECDPWKMCSRPATGATITVFGINRRDGEHHWSEVNPTIRWSKP